VDLLKVAQGELPEWENHLAACRNPHNYNHFILTLAGQSVIRENWGFQAQPPYANGDS
jgi:hypothetical protein